MEIVVFGCGGIEHTKENECEIFNAFEKSNSSNIAIGFDIKSPPLCSYCLSRIVELLSNPNLKVLTLAFMGSMPTAVMNAIYTAIKDKQGQQALPSCSSGVQPLDEINIRWADLQLLDKQMQQFIKDINHTRSLNLKLDATRLSDIHAADIIKQLNNNNSDNSQSFLPNIPQNRVLDLSLSGNMLGKLSILALCDAIRSFSDSLCTLKLNLSQNDITDELAQLLGESIQNSQTNLQSVSIDLSESQVDALALPAIIQYLPKNLKEFNLKYNDNMVGDEQLKEFCDNLITRIEKNKLLELSIQLGLNEINDEGGLNLAKVIEHFSNLKVLQLGLKGNNITDESLSVLFKAIGGLPELVHVGMDLAAIQTNDLSGIQCLFKTTSNQSNNLISILLNLQDNSISKKGIQDLSDAIISQGGSSKSQNVTQIQSLSINLFYIQSTEYLDILYTALIQKYLQSSSIPLPDYSIASEITSDESTYLQELSQIFSEIPQTITSKMISKIAQKKFLGKYLASRLIELEEEL